MSNKFGPRLYLESILKAGLDINKEIEPGSQRTGFVLHILTVRSNGEQDLESFCLGTPGESFIESNLYAAEMIARLEGRRRAGASEYTSGESACRRLLQYAGAVLTFDEDGGQVYFSMSGLVDTAAEAISYCLAERLGLKMPVGYVNPLLPVARSALKGCVV